MIKKILLTFICIPCLAWADRFVYDSLYIGMDLNKAELVGYNKCETDVIMGKKWLSCTSDKKFFPQFQGYSIDDVEIELANGKTILAINLITSVNVNPTKLADKVNGTITAKGGLSLISVKNHDEDSLIVAKGKIIIMNNNPR